MPAISLFAAEILALNTSSIAAIRRGYECAMRGR